MQNAFPSSSASSPSTFGLSQSTLQQSQSQYRAANASFTASSDSLHHGGTDPNAPEIFRANLQMAIQGVDRVHALARSALDGIENAYRSGHSPVHTKSLLETLQQTLRMLSEMLRHTGVGALPLVPSGSSEEPPAILEDKLAQETTRAYERLRRAQDSASVVANLLGNG
ncbi:hypothetical protein PLICRDRAFT_114895 [Plicaturopsis crispa FD-325 SS-3]|nr:hypothetical protein PLICRDRAFT_114895 [Plicaturopsis crispa FD-325 SS-3]